MRTTFVIAACAMALSLSACATYLDDLNRAQRHYEANEHERALALFRVLEADMNSLSHADRTRYAYLRGMNDYRLKEPYRADARHWLALARAMERQQPGGLTGDWKERLEEALRDLNQDVYGTGVFPEEPGAEGASPGAPPPPTPAAPGGATSSMPLAPTGATPPTPAAPGGTPPPTAPPAR